MILEEALQIVISLAFLIELKRGLLDWA